MTRSVEIPDKAVEAAARAIQPSLWNTDDPAVRHAASARAGVRDAACAALSAALPYLVPAASRERAAQRMWELHAQEQSWEELSDLGKDQMRSEADEVLRFAGIRFAPAGDGGLREALEALSEWLRDELKTGVPLTVVDAPEAFELAADRIDATLRSHPAAPAVPQPATLPTCVNCESETFQCSACGSLVEPWESAAPQPVNREALIMALSPIIGLLVRATNPVSLAQRERMTELNAGKAADAVLAVLAGEQEQVEK